MAISYGLTNPAAFINSVETYPDLFKFYTVVPTRSTESSAANQRRPVLYTSLSGGIGWKYESQSSGFYYVNYGGNFYFKASDNSLTAFAHKSASSSYDAYKARCGSNNIPIVLGNQSWEISSAIPYNTTNQPNREICKCPGSNRYFCVKDGGGLAYNDTAWSTANWTTTTFNTSFTFSDDGGFKHICVNPESDHDALVYFVTNDSNRYIRICLCNLNDLSVSKDYTSTIFGSTTLKRSNYLYLSIDYSPYIGGYIIFYNKSGNTRICRRILYTRDPSTGTPYAWNNYQASTEHAFGPSGTQLVQYGSHGWYCPWTEEYFLVGSANAVFWTKDGTSWYMSPSRTSASTSTVCQKFLTDGTNMVIATSGSSYYYSNNKGTTWNSGTSLSPNGFNTGRSNDTIVLPFRCTNNLFRVQPSVTLGYTLDSNTGQPVANAANFYTNEYIPINSNTSYVVYGKNKTTKLLSYYISIAWYDSSKNFISRSNTINAYRVGMFTSPSNAVYARIRCNLDGTAVTQEAVDSYKWYFAKESDFKVITKYGDIVCN